MLARSHNTGNSISARQRFVIPNYTLSDVGRRRGQVEDGSLGKLERVPTLSVLLALLILSPVISGDAVHPIVRCLAVLSAGLIVLIGSTCSDPDEVDGRDSRQWIDSVVAYLEFRAGKSWRLWRDRKHPDFAIYSDAVIRLFHLRYKTLTCSCDYCKHGTPFVREKLRVVAGGKRRAAIAASLVAVMALSGCGGGGSLVPMAKAAPVPAPTVLPPGRTPCFFSSGSAIVETPAGSGHYFIGAETGFPVAGHYYCELPVLMPAGSKLVKFQGGYSFRTECGGGQFLAYLSVDGAQWASRNFKGAVRADDRVLVPIEADIPIPISGGDVRLVLAADVECAWTPSYGLQSFEVQGDIQVQR